jgi:hypothetical protein
MYQHENKFYPPYAFPTLGLQFWHKPMSQAFSAGEYSYWPLLVVPRDQRVAAKAPKFLFCPAQSNKNKVDTWYVNVSYGYNYGKFGDWLDGYSAPKSVTAESVKNPSSVLMLCESRQMVGYGRSSRPDETKGCAYLYPPGPETLNRFWTPTNCEQYMANRHPVGGPKATSFVPVLWADGHSSKEIRKGLYSSESVTKWGFVPDK